MLVLPDDTVFEQGIKGHKLYFIAEGDCQVGVNDHTGRLTIVREMDEGSLFGEISLILDIGRTATVVSSNYCTMATITQDVLLVLFQSYPDIFKRMKEKALSYDNKDVWKKFKLLLLDQVDYFNVDV